MTYADQLLSTGRAIDVELADLRSRLDAALAEVAAAQTAAAAAEEAAVETQAALDAAIASAADGFTIGVTRPDATNAGVPAGLALTTVTGAVTITTPGLYVGVRFTGPVSIQSPGVVWLHCQADQPVTHTHKGATGTVMWRSTLRVASPTSTDVCITGHDVTLIQCDISGGVDGVRISNAANPDGPSGVRLWGCFLHDLAFFTVPASMHSDLITHNDLVQIEGGTGTDIWGCHLVGRIRTDAGQPARNPRAPYAMSCIMVTPNVGRVDGLRIRQCWLDGGYVHINLSEKSRGPITALEMTDLRSSGQTAIGKAVLVPSATRAANGGGDWTGIDESTGKALVFSRG